ncbi:MAG TPA: polysaccharide biosynthesis/export family protein [Pyrinomonadaceae bacterium]|nr:polysaccharide biosynthesis/export family protein [Pyrinomonadaceae bacterium]
MKSLHRFLMTLSLAILVSGGAEVYAQISAQSPGSPQMVPAVDAAKTRQRMVTKTADQKTQNPAKKIDDPSEVLVLTDEEAAKSSTSGNSELTTPAGSVGSNNSNRAAMGDVQPKTVPEAKDSLKKQTGDPAQDNRHEQASEEAAIIPYYNNFFNTYRLGPEDIISVNVFGQDRYSRTGITVPPSGRVSLALIPGGIFVNGKTVEEVAEAITRKYDEFIIDPQVSVSLDKASSYRYSVVGDVAQPGIRLMNRRLTVTEALSEAGGVLSTGNRSKVVVLRRQANGNLEPIAVNVSAIYKGKAPDTTYLVPGDQILVPGNKLKSLQKIMTFFPVLNFARIFTGGIF